MSLGAPTNLTAVVVSSSEVALSWGAVDGAILYHISINGTSGPVAVQTFANIDELAPGEYTFAARAEAFDGFESVLGPWSETVTVDTTTEAPAPPAELAAPVIDTAKSVGLGGTAIGWGAVEGAEGYEVRIDGGDPIDLGNVLGYAESDLEEEQRTYEVRAYNLTADPDLFSAWSAPVTVDVLAGLAPPEVEATVLSDSIIDLTWEPVPGADRYEVRINAADPIPAGSLLEFRASDLVPDTTYTFEVRALVLGDPDDTFGPWSDPLSATTFPFVAPPAVEPLLKRLTHFLHNRGITARAVNTELNNIYLLLGSELGFTQPTEEVEPPFTFEPDADEPEPAPLPEPDEEPLPPDPPEPPPLPASGILFARDLQADALAGTTTLANGDRVRIYDLMDLQGSPLTKVTGRTTLTSNELRLGWVREVGRLLQGIDRLGYSLQLGDIGSGGGFRVRFDRVRADGSSVLFAGLGTSYNASNKFTTISRVEVSDNPPVWNAGDRLRLSVTLFRTTGAEMWLEAFTQSAAAFVDVDTAPDCSDQPPPAGTTQDTSILLDSTVTKTFESVFNAPFPGTGNTFLIRIRSQKYAALSFNTGDLPTGATGRVTVNNTPQIHTGRVAVSFSKCPGDFGPHLGDKCRKILVPWSIPNSMGWIIDTPSDGSRCSLEANTDYYLNIMPATSLPPDGSPTWDGSGSSTSAGCIINARRLT